MSAKVIQQLIFGFPFRLNQTTLARRSDPLSFSKAVVGWAKRSDAHRLSTCCGPSRPSRLQRIVGRGQVEALDTPTEMYIFLYIYGGMPLDAITYTTPRPPC